MNSLSRFVWVYLKATFLKLKHIGRVNQILHSNEPELFVADGNALFIEPIRDQNISSHIAEFGGQKVKLVNVARALKWSN